MFGGWFPVIVLVAVIVAVLRMEANLVRTAKESGLRQAEAQIAASIKDGEADIQREVSALQGQRQQRATATVATQKARATSDQTKRKTDPGYGNWARQPVPDDVVAGLRDGAGTASGVRGDAADSGNAQPVVRPEGTPAAGKDGQRPAGAIRLGPARRDH